MADEVMSIKLLLSLALVSTLCADLVKTKTLACPSISILQKAADVDMQDSLKLEMYAIAHGCVIVGREDKIEALGYDPRNSKEIFQKIYYEKSNSELYLRRSAIIVEQGGKKNGFRF
jgi:hypothetical protein